MGALTGNVWVCAECRSINNERAKQCYNCRTPRDRAAVDPATIEGTGHGKLREVALPPFESPRPYAVIASIGVLAAAAAQALYTLNFAALTNQMLDGTEPTPLQLAFMGTLGLATLGVGVVGLVAWSLWLSSAVAAMPALGLGYPAATRLTAFVENFLPGLNLLRVPAIVRDVVRRIDPDGARGEALIFAAWIGLLGGFVVPRAFGFINGFSAESPEAALRSQLTIQEVAIGLVIVGAIFLVALIWWIEQRIARRREEQLAGADAATAGAAVEPVELGQTADEAVAMPETTEHIPAAPPATVRWSWGESSDSPIAASAGFSPHAVAGSAAGWDTELLPPLQREAGHGVASGPAPPPAGEPPPTGEPPSAAAAEAPAPAAQATLPATPVPAAPGPAASVPEPTQARAAEIGARHLQGPDSPAAAPAAEAAVEAQRHMTPPPQREAASESQPATVARQVSAPVPPGPAPEFVLAREPAPAEHPEPAGTPAGAANGAPHLTIRIANRGMVRAEMAGEAEHVILEDLSAYGQALANVGGTAEIVVAGSDAMAPLIARRAQRILAEAGIEASIPD